ncbi:hypothetical protein PGTUg99_018645 [Puccinia graminis f. sp. tritici]|uniref:No apical meristem-associated C-terminal domain-containing protein n=1 Tax=Puccinia graminis f. sp. tritici TaxID=56615 RepID=A0A5B0QR23_PUCGR|nr:hypothetical protein PGTUg99_018645 [Puccinia graminis f. sp. tritici]
MSSSTNDVLSPTAIDVEGDESEPSRSVLGQVCLEGSKAAKRKRAEDASIHSIVSMQKDLVTISRERLASMNAAKDDAIIRKREKKDREQKEKKEKKEKEEREKKEKERKEKEEAEEEEDEDEENDGQNDYDGENDSDSENDDNGDAEEETEE